eukprot:16344-Hanusia_phi.AAC.4
MRPATYRKARRRPLLLHQQLRRDPELQLPVRQPLDVAEVPRQAHMPEHRLLHPQAQREVPLPDAYRRELVLHPAPPRLEPRAVALPPHQPVDHVLAARAPLVLPRLARHHQVVAAQVHLLHGIGAGQRGTSGRPCPNDPKINRCNDTYSNTYLNKWTYIH